MDYCLFQDEKHRAELLCVFAEVVKNTVSATGVLLKNYPCFRMMILTQFFSNYKFTLSDVFG